MVALARHTASSVGLSLTAYLDQAVAADPRLSPTAETVAALAAAAVRISRLIAHGPLTSLMGAGALGETTGAANADGDVTSGTNSDQSTRDANASRGTETSSAPSTASGSSRRGNVTAS